MSSASEVPSSTAADPVAALRPPLTKEGSKLYKYEDRRPAEVEAGPGSAEEYRKWRESTDLREPYRVPVDFLLGTKKFTGPTLAEAPLIVFVNSKSGGRCGPAVAQAMSRAISHSQVFDLGEDRPGPVLKQMFKNLQQGITEKSHVAQYIAENLCILAAGGDGTVAWILKTIHDLGLQPAPHVAVCPLGTGNDLALSFGWGNRFLDSWIADHSAIYTSLARVAAAKRIDLDCWRIKMTAGNQDVFTQLPHSMEPNKSFDSRAEVSGLFWNYASFGIDAEAAWGFAHLRETKPSLASRRFMNMGWYAYFSCHSGWFCPGHAFTKRMNIKLKTKNKAGEMEEVRLPSNVSAIVLLNLQSYGGGRDLWGLKDTRPETTGKQFTPPIFNDGKFEVVGLRSGWHTALVMGKFSRKVHAMRLAQTSHLVIEALSTGPSTSETHMQLDGEPWPQAVPPKGSSPLTVEVSHAYKSYMLFNSQYPQGPKEVKKLVKRAAGITKIQEQDTRPMKEFASVILTADEQRTAISRLVPSMSTKSMALTRTATGKGPFAEDATGSPDQ